MREARNGVFLAEDIPADDQAQLRNVAVKKPLAVPGFPKASDEWGIRDPDSRDLPKRFLSHVLKHMGDMSSFPDSSISSWRAALTFPQRMYARPFALSPKGEREL